MSCKLLVHPFHFLRQTADTRIWQALVCTDDKDLCMKAKIYKLHLNICRITNPLETLSSMALNRQCENFEHAWETRLTWPIPPAV